MKDERGDKENNEKEISNEGEREIRKKRKIK